MSHLAIATLLASLAAGFVAITILDRHLRERAPALNRAMVANLVLFNLLTAIGLGYRLVELNAGPAATAATPHLLSGLILALSVLKMAWLRSLGALAQTLRRRKRSRRTDTWLTIAAGVAALAAAAGWVEAARTGRLAIGLAVALATDLVTLCGIVVIAGALWRESAAETGTCTVSAAPFWTMMTLWGVEGESSRQPVKAVKRARVRMNRSMGAPSDEGE